MNLRYQDNLGHLNGYDFFNVSDQSNFQSVGPYTNEDNEVKEPWQGRNISVPEEEFGDSQLVDFDNRFDCNLVEYDGPSQINSQFQGSTSNTENIKIQNCHCTFISNATYENALHQLKRVVLCCNFR